MSKRSRNEAEEARKNPPPPSPRQLWVWEKTKYDRLEREARREAARERIRNMKMPSHPEPKRGDTPYYLESQEAYERRLARWRAKLNHKKHRK